MSVDHTEDRLGLNTLDFDRQVVGKLLLDARTRMGFTLKQVEAGAGVAASHIWNIEKGRKEVSTERLIRLASFFGFPIGLLLEAGLLVKYEPILESAHAEAESLREKFGWKELTPNRRELLVELVTGLAVVLTYLMRSTRPGFLVECFSFPSLKLKNSLRRKAYAIEYEMPPVERMSYLITLPLLPGKALAAFGILDGPMVLEFEATDLSGNSNIQRPWRPVPVTSMASFAEAIHVPEMSMAEFKYIKSLSSRATHSATSRNAVKLGID